MPEPTVFRSTSDYHGPLTPVYDTPNSFTPAGCVAKGTDLNGLPFPAYTGLTWA